MRLAYTSRHVNRSFQIILAALGFFVSLRYDSNIMARIKKSAEHRWLGYITEVCAVCGLNRLAYEEHRAPCLTPGELREREEWSAEAKIAADVMQRGRSAA